MNFIRLTALSILLLSSLSVVAQQAIDSAMKALEKSKSVTNEVYSERRDPGTKTVVSSNRLYEFTDDALANKLIDAIRKERGNASSFQMNNRNPNAGYAITFESKDGRSYAKYALVQKGELWVFSVIKSTVRVNSSKKRGKDRSEYHEIPSVSLSFDGDLDGLDMALLDNNGCSMLTGVTPGVIYDSKGNRISVEGTKEDALTYTHTTTTVSRDGKTIVTITSSDPVVEAAAQTIKEANCVAIQARAEARKAAAEARAVALRQAAEARAVAAEARAKTLREAAETRKKAAEARKKAAEARAKAAKARKSQKSSSTSYYYFSSID
ncbi:MAG: DUF5024 domain-containing protein [Bacteroides sp.]|nr:DUF5024 domain-containing protein [Bacteroides sp.]